MTILGLGIGAFNKVMHPDCIDQAACTCRHISRERENVCRSGYPHLLTGVITKLGVAHWRNGDSKLDHLIQVGGWDLNAPYMADGHHP